MKDKLNKVYHKQSLLYTVWCTCIQHTSIETKCFIVCRLIYLLLDFICLFKQTLDLEIGAFERAQIVAVLYVLIIVVWEGHRIICRLVWMWSKCQPFHSAIVHTTNWNVPCILWSNVYRILVAERCVQSIKAVKMNVFYSRMISLHCYQMIWIFQFMHISINTS